MRDRFRSYSNNVKCLIANRLIFISSGPRTEKGHQWGVYIVCDWFCVSMNYYLNCKCCIISAHKTTLYTVVFSLLRMHKGLFPVFYVPDLFPSFFSFVSIKVKKNIYVQLSDPGYMKLQH